MKFYCVCERLFYQLASVFYFLKKTIIIIMDVDVNSNKLLEKIITSVLYLVVFYPLLIILISFFIVFDLALSFRLGQVEYIKRSSDKFFPGTKQKIESVIDEHYPVSKLNTSSFMKFHIFQALIIYFCSLQFFEYGDLSSMKFFQHYFFYHLIFFKGLSIYIILNVLLSRKFNIPIISDFPKLYIKFHEFRFKMSVDERYR